MIGIGWVSEQIQTTDGIDDCREGECECRIGKWNLGITRGAN